MAFEAVLASARPTTAGRWRRVTVAVSIAVHAVALAIGVAYSFWTIEDLPMPAVAVTLVGGAPPPPPPPPAKRHSTGKTKPHIEKPHTLVQPKEHQEAPKEKPKDEEDAKDDGQEGGVKGGVAGGVVGGVVGAPPPKDTGPKMVSPLIARQQLLIDPNADAYKVTLPPPLARTGMRFSAVVRVCVSTQGTVSEVKVLRGADPAIDPQIPTVLGRWRYRPYMIDGQPVPFCYTIRYDVSAR